MNEFQFHTPERLEDALSLLDQYGDDARVFAGGTALLLFMKQRFAQPDHLVSLQKIPALDGIDVTDGEIRLGAMLTHRTVETSPLLQETVSLLGETYRHVATTRIRNMATVGGGLVHGDPNLDPPPSLIVLGAKAVLASSSGERTVPVEEFFLDYYETAIQPGEIVTQVIVPIVPPNTGTVYIKFLPRTADDYATVSVAALLTLDDDNSTCKEVKIGLGSLGTIPIRGRQAEDVLRGKAISPELIRQAAEAAEEEVDPMDDFRGSAPYKQEMAKVFTRRALEQALAKAQGVSS